MHNVDGCLHTLYSARIYSNKLETLKLSLSSTACSQAVSVHAFTANVMQSRSDAAEMFVSFDLSAADAQLPSSTTSAEQVDCGEAEFKLAFCSASRKQL